MPWSRALRRIAFVGLAAPLLLAACDGREPSPAPPPTPTATLPATPRPSATPTPLKSLAAELASAEEQRAVGAYEEALASYRALVEQAQGLPRQQALWGLAQTYLDLDQFSQAAETLQALLDSQPEAPMAQRARYLLGLALSRVARSDEALAAFQAYIDSGGPATPYARLEMAALLLASDGRQAEAAEELEAALAADLPPSRRISTLLSLGQARIASGHLGAALLAFQEVLSSGAKADRAAALWNLADLYHRLGDEAARLASLRRLVAEYPDQAPALEALDALALAGSPASPFQEGVVLFFRRRNPEAEAAFAQVLAAGPSPQVAGETYYYLAILAERRGDMTAALGYYEAALAADPAGPLAAEAAWWRAQLLETAGSLEEALAAYMQLADAYPLSRRAGEALFRAGLIRYQQGRPAEAIPLWTRYRDTVSGPATKARASFWLGRAALAVGDRLSAEEHLRQALVADPFDYYGLRAQALLAPGAPLTAEGALSLEPLRLDWPEVEAWLTSFAGPEEPSLGVGLTSLPRWQRGQELALMGFSQEAAQEFNALIDDVAREPWRLYRLMRALRTLGQAPAAARSAARLMQAAPDPPGSLLAVAYPQDFLSLVTAEAQHYDLSPLLVLALIRQESFFDAKAISFAGARGLTQVIPSTGREIAAALGIPDFHPEDLLRPLVSVRFGIYYLADQLERFDGRLEAALAAYNGGPGNALRWQRQAPQDPDLFVETIDLEETNLYVRLVLAHYALYRFLYGLSATPMLPLS